ncbi:MAG: MFS transporter [Candidatus Lokiarchaeota archaeon]|nr:MFS transporter [Candidatus Lokiarchaeota archaeon]
MSENKRKFDVKHTFLIGLAFFSSAIAWDMYDSQVSISLYNYLAGLGLTGLLLGLDNLVGVFIQPIMGSVSDNTRTKFGRRIPYILIGIPVGALFFALIPFESSLISLLIFMFLFIVSMSMWRSQAVALMPDFVHPESRSKGNSIINIMGGLGLVGSTLISYTIVDFSLQLAFIVVSAIMLISLVVLFFTVKEKDAYAYQALLAEEKEAGEKIKTKKEKVSLISSFKDIIKEEDKSTLFVLLAIFFAMSAYYGLMGLFTVYAQNTLSMTRGEAGGLKLFAGLTFLIAAFPLSVLAEKFGRKLFIKIGLVIFIIGALIGFSIPTRTVTIIALILLGIGYACIIVNTIVIVWAMAPSEKKIGTYTGVYYAFSFLAAIIAPGIFEGFAILFTWNSFFLIGAIILVIALVFMFLVKRESAELTEEQKLAKQKAIQEL